MMPSVRSKADRIAYLVQLRPYQWTKNLLVFLPALAAHDFSQPTLTKSLLAFVALSLCASAGYLINDIVDLDHDRGHPIKQLRPLASGRIQKSLALAVAGTLLIGSFALAASVNVKLLGIVAFYFALAGAYSLLLKRRILVDVITLGVLYTLRVFAGGAATSIPISPWLLALSLFLFLSLAIVKRYAELTQRKGTPGRGYVVADLPILASLAAASGFSAVVVLALYVNSPAVAAQYDHPEFLWIVCVLLAYWISRLLLVANRGQLDEDPIIYAFTDRISLLTGVIAAAAVIAAFALG